MNITGVDLLLKNVAKVQTKDGNYALENTRNGR